MFIQLRQWLLLIILTIILRLSPSIGQVPVICPTAAWNQTFRVVVGISGVASTTATTFNYPYDFYLTSNNTLFVSDMNNNRIQRFNPGSVSGTTLPGLSLWIPAGVDMDSSGALYILDSNNFRVLRWINNVATVVAGGRGAGSAFDRMSTSYNIFVDSTSNIYLSDFANHRVTFWAANNPNISQLVAGGYGAGSSSERLNNPLGLFVDSSGIIYIADYSNHRIQRWFPGAAIGQTVAGESAVAGPWSYQLNLPASVIYDQAANFLYIMDSGNRRVMRWVPGASYGIPIIQAPSMSSPRGMRFDSVGNIFIADANMHRIIQFAITCPSAPTTTTTPTTQATVPICPTAEWNQTFNVIAGVTGSRGSSQILFNDPYSTAFDRFGNLFVVDSVNDRIQFFSRGSMTATTVAGITLNPGGSYSQLNNPSAIFVDANNQMYILDTSNCRVLRWLIGEPMGYPVAGDQGCGSALTQITTSYAMHVDQAKNIYVSEFSNHRVTFWSANNRSFGALVAGGHGAGSTSERLNGPWGIHIDSNQNLYIVDRNNHRVQFWLNGAMSGTTVAGSSGDPGPWAYQFSSPTAIAVDRFGFLYVLDTGNGRVQKWWPGASFGTTVIAGVLSTPYGLQFDNQGNLVITDTSNLRVISLGLTCPQTTTTTTVGPTIAQTTLCPTAQWNATGNNLAGVTGTQGATTTLIRSPQDVCFDAQQNLYVVDTGNHRIQFYPRGSMTGSTIAGSTSNPGAALSQLNSPSSIYIDANRVMFILDTSNFRVLRWNFGEPRGHLVLGGNGNGAGFNQISWSYGMFVDSQYNIYISDNGNSRVTLWSSTNRTSGILVAGGNGAGNTIERLNGPWGIFVDVNQTMFIVDRNNHRVVRWLQGALSGVTVAGSTSDPGSWSYQFSSPTAITMDDLGFMYILDWGNGRLQRWIPFASFGVTIVGSSFSSPVGMQMDRANNFIIADTANHRVVSHAVLCPAITTTTALPPTLASVPVCVTAQWNQTFTVIAGTSGTRGSTATLLNDPTTATFDAHGNLYVADTVNDRIQFFPRGSLIGTTIAGSTGSGGATFSQLNNPMSIYVDPNRVMFILDTSNFRVLRWNFGEPRGHLVLGGNGNGAALNQLGWCYGMFVDPQYNIYVSDSSNSRVTLWLSTNRTSGILVAGGNGAGNTPTRLNNPWGIFVDVNGSLFIADRNNHRISLWEPGSLSGITVAGTTSDAGPYAYQLNNPIAVSMDQNGFLYILDSANARIQRWWPRASYGTTVVASAFSTPYGMIIDPRGNLVVTDTFNLRVLSFAMTCPSPTTTTAAPPTQAIVPVCPTAQWNQTFNTLAGSMSTAGSTSTLFSSPADVTFDVHRNMYVVDINNHRVQRFAPGSSVGTTVAGVTASWGATRSQLSSPYAIHVTTNSTMYILDMWNFRVLRWESNEPMGTIVAGGQGNGAAFNQMGWTYAMFVDEQENIFVSENGNHRVMRWGADNRTSGILMAGGNGAGSTLDKLNAPWGIYVRNNGTYIVDRGNHRVVLWNFGASLAAVVAGSTGDPGPWSYQFSSPTAISFDQLGFMYILDAGNNRIQRYVPYAAYGITVARATMSTPLGMTFDRSGNLVVADTSFHRVISFAMTCPPTTTTTVAPPTQPMVPVCPTAIWNQTVITLAGSMSTAGSTSTLLSGPYDTDWDEFGNMYVVDRNNHRIQRFHPNSNAGMTVAGFSLSAGSSRSELWNPAAIYLGPNQIMFILDTSNARVLRWPLSEPLGDVIVGGRGVGAGFHQIGTSQAMFLDAQLNIYVSEQSNHRVTLWYNGNTTAGVLVAGGNGAGNTADKLNSPWGIYVDVNRTIFVVDRGNHRVMRWTEGATLGVLVAGATSDPGPWAFQLNNPTSITMDPFGFMYILDFSNSRVQRWSPGASFGTTVVSASMSSPIGLRFDRVGSLVIADTSFHRIISFAMTCPPASTTTTAAPIPTTTPLCPTNIWNQTFSIVAGSTGGAGATATLLNDPHDVAIDGRRNMYVVDYNNHRIQRFSPGSSSAVTVAGSTGVWGSARSLLYYPTAIFVTSNGTMFILDTWNHRVLRWSAGEPMGTLVAGGQGNGGAFNQIGTSYQLFVDDQFNVYVSESTNHRVTRWSTTNTTSGVLMAGGNGAGNSPDKLNSPWGIYIYNNATYIVDRSNHRVQKWDFGASVASTVAGSTSDPGPWAYQLNSPTSITMDPYGFLYILDFTNERIQKWLPGALFGITVVAADLWNAYGMAMDPLGNFYIADTSNERIISFGLLCPPTTTTTALPATQATVPICSTATWNQTGVIIAGATSNPGSTSTLLSAPYDIDFDIHGNMYVVDHNNDRIQRILRGSTVGTTVAGFTIGTGSSRSELNNPSAIYVTNNGVMYILDTFNYRTLRWTIGDPLGFVVTGGRGSGATFDRMGVTYGMFVDSQENIYLSEQSNHRVTLWYNGNTTAGVLVAGGNGAGNTADKLNSPWGIYVDSNQVLFIVDRGNHRIVRWMPGMNFGVTVAGSTSDPGPWAFQLNNPTSITMDPFGFMYILDFSNSRVQRWTPGASFGTTVVSASMSSPIGLRFDRVGNLVVADTSFHRVLSFAMTCPQTTTTTTPPPTQARVPLCATAAWNGTASTIAGVTSSAGSTATLLSAPYDIGFDAQRNMYVVDYNNHRVQRFRFGSNTGTTVAGFSLSSGASRSELNGPGAIHVQSDGLMYIADGFNCRILSWQPNEPMGTVVVNGRGCGSTFDRIGRPFGIFVDSQLNIYVSENTNHRVTKWLNGNNTASVLVAGGNGAGVSPERLSWPWGLFVDSNEGVYVVDRGNHRVQFWPAGAALGTTVAGDSNGGAGSFSFQLNSPTSLLFDPQGAMFVLDSGNGRVQKWIIGSSFGTTVLAATMSSPLGMYLDLLGNLAVADTNFHRVQLYQVWCQPTTTTTSRPPTHTPVPLCPTAEWNSSSLLLTGSLGAAGSTPTFVNLPLDVTFDQYRQMYVADHQNHRIQRYSPGSNVGTTVAGITGSPGSSLAQLNNPSAIYVDRNDGMYILDTTNCRVLKWEIGDPFGRVLINGRGCGSTLDRIGTSYAMFVDSQFDIYVSENTNHRVTKWLNGNNVVGQIVAGGAGAGSTSDKLWNPWGIYVDSTDQLYVVDRSNHRVQRWTVGTAFGTTVAGESGVAGSWSYQLSSPTGIMFDVNGLMYILDAGNSRIVRWTLGMSFGITIIASSMNTPYSFTLDYSNNFIVADSSNHRIISYNVMCVPTTTAVSAIPTLAANLACQTGVFNLSWTVVAGTSGVASSADTHLSSPHDVFVDGNFNIFIADNGNSRIMRYRQGATSGNNLAGFTLAGGSAPPQLRNPSAIFVSLSGAMFVADTLNYRVQKWLPNEPLGTTVAGGRGNGATLDRVGLVYGIFVDAQESIYVSENSNHRVTLWYAWNTTAGELVAGVSSPGNTSTQLNSPWGVHVDSNRTVYVVDRANHRVQAWLRGRSFGVTVAGVTGVSGSTATLLNSPTAITVDSDNFMFIMDAGNNRVQRFPPNSLVADTIVSAPFNNPRGMRLDPIGNLYITDMNNHRVLFFRCVYNMTTTTITTVTTTSGPSTTTTTTTTTTRTTTSSTSSTSTTTRTTTTSATTTTTSTSVTTVTTTTPSVTTVPTTVITTSTTTTTATTTTSVTTSTETTSVTTIGTGTTVTTTSTSATTQTTTTSVTTTTTTATTTTSETTTTVSVTTTTTAATTTVASTTSTTTTTTTTTTPSTTVTTTTTTLPTTTGATTTTTVATTTVTTITTTTTLPTTTGVTTTISTTSLASTVGTTTGAPTTPGVIVVTVLVPGPGSGSGSGSGQQSSGSSTQQDSNTAILVGGIVGGLTLLGLIIGVILYLIKSFKGGSAAVAATQVTTVTPKTNAAPSHAQPSSHAQPPSQSHAQPPSQSHAQPPSQSHPAPSSQSQPKTTPPSSSTTSKPTPTPKPEVPTNSVTDVPSTNQQTSTLPMNVSDRSYRIHIIK